MTTGGLSEWGSVASRICTEPLVLGWIPSSLVTDRNMEVAAGWEEYAVNKICSEPRSKANRLGVDESSGELLVEHTISRLGIKFVCVCLCWGTGEENGTCQLLCSQ